MSCGNERRPKKPQNLAIAALVTSAVVVGFAPLFIRWSDVGPVATGFYRMALAQPLIWLLALREKPASARTPTTDAGSWLLFLLAGASFGIVMASWNVSILMTSVANATLFINTAPFFVALGALKLFGEKITSGFMAGLVMALTGMLILSGANWSASGRALVGDGVAFVSAALYAVHLLSLRQLRMRNFGVWTILVRSGAAAVATLLVVMAIFALTTDVPWLPASGAAWGNMIVYALLCQVVGQVLMVYGFAYLPASFSSLILLLQTVVAAGLAWTLFGESLTWLQGLGGALAIAGVWIAKPGSKDTPTLGKTKDAFQS